MRTTHTAVFSRNATWMVVLGLHNNTPSMFSQRLLEGIAATGRTGRGLPTGLPVSSRCGLPQNVGFSRDTSSGDRVPQNECRFLEIIFRVNKIIQILAFPG